MNERYALTLVVPPPYEPLTLVQAKKHLRIDDDITDQDALIRGLIIAARRWCERFTNRSLVVQTWELRTDSFPGNGFLPISQAILGGVTDVGELRLPRGPVLSVAAINYLDFGGTLQTWDEASYQVDIYSEPARIKTAYNKVWPITRYDMNAVTVRYTAGYPVGSPDDEAGYGENVPQELKQAMLLVIGHLYEHREAVPDVVRAAQDVEMPMGAQWLAWSYRVDYL